MTIQTGEIVQREVLEEAPLFIDSGELVGLSEITLAWRAVANMRNPDNELRLQLYEEHRKGFDFPGTSSYLRLEGEEKDSLMFALWNMYVGRPYYKTLDGVTHTVSLGERALAGALLGLRSSPPNGPIIGSEPIKREWPKSRSQPLPLPPFIEGPILDITDRIGDVIYYMRALLARNAKGKDN